MEKIEYRNNLTAGAVICGGGGYKLEITDTMDYKIIGVPHEGKSYKLGVINKSTPSATTSWDYINVGWVLDDVYLVNRILEKYNET